MIISHRYRYLFIEIPLTGSWAIRNELCRYYEGMQILHKHASYWEFERHSEEHEKRYFVFAAVRNPLDKLVSRYFKLKTNHKGAYTDSKATDRLLVEYSDRRKHEAICSSEASFHEAFSMYWKRPYSDMIDLSSADLDFVIRFEQMQRDFSRVLKVLDIPQARPVPIVNKTRLKEERWEIYYTAEIIPAAQKACGPFMRKWGYDFPEAWDQYHYSWRRDLEFRFFASIRGLYLQHIRFNRRNYAKLARRLRASLFP